MANAVARFFSRWKRLSSLYWPLPCSSLKEIARVLISKQQGFHPAAQLVVSLASLVQITIALRRRKAESLREDGNIRVRSTVHFTNRVFCHLPVGFNLRTDGVRSRLRPASHNCNMAHPWPRTPVYNR